MTQFDSCDSSLLSWDEGSGLSRARFTVVRKRRSALRKYREPFTRACAKLPVGEEFAALATQWREEVQFISSASQRVSHPAYLRIIGMGEPVIRSVLADLELTHSDWSTALVAITGEDPTTEDDWGDARALAVAWLRWAKERGPRS